MLKISLSGITFSALVLMAGPAFAGGASTLSPDDEIVPVVSPGDKIGISCEALEVAQPNSDVRVVLTVSAQPGVTPPDYSKVMATDESFRKGSVSVHVPNTPQIANHTYSLSVYVVDPKGSQSCDVGHVKVTQSVSELDDPAHQRSKHS